MKAKKIGSYEAKTKLSKILDRVANGEEFVITKHGMPVANLVPFGSPSKTETKETIRQLLRLREQNKASLNHIANWIKKGRR